MAKNAKDGAMSEFAVMMEIIAAAKYPASAFKSNRIRCKSVTGRKNAAAGRSAISEIAVMMVITAAAKYPADASKSNKIRCKSATGHKNAAASARATTIIAGIVAGNAITEAARTTATGTTITMIADTAGIIARTTGGSRPGEMTAVIIGADIATVIATITNPAAIIRLIGGTAIAGTG